MKIAFNRSDGLIIVPAVATGPKGDVEIRFIIDTGANSSTLSPSTLESIGYQETDFELNGEIITAGGKQSIEVVVVNKLSALGVAREHFTVLRHRLPIPVDGLLGLDFFYDNRIIIDMREATIEVD